MSGRVLVTGARGNVGRVLVPYLRSGGWEVYETDSLPGVEPGYFPGDIRTSDLERIAGLVRPQAVINLAAVCGRINTSLQPETALDVNVRGAFRVARVAATWEAPLVHFSSSEAIYGANWYGKVKRMSEEAVLEAHPGAVVVRPFMMYHESETPGPHRSAMIRFATAIARGETFEVHEGTSRSWLHLDDAVRIVERLLLSEGARGLTLDIGNPEAPLSPLMLARELDMRIGRDAQFTYVPQPEGMVAYKQPDLRLQTLLTGDVTVPHREGIARVAATVIEREGLNE